MINLQDHKEGQALFKYTESFVRGVMPFTSSGIEYIRAPVAFAIAVTAYFKFYEVWMIQG